jgi:hypothetical protein
MTTPARCLLIKRATACFNLLVIVMGDQIVRRHIVPRLWTGCDMFQLFLRARAHNYLRGFTGEREFKARSAERDAETDRLRVEAVIRSLEDALNGAEAEQTGLTRRVDDVLSRAAVTFGNGNDEYLSREKLDSDHLDLFEKEISNGQRRLRELTISITHFKFLKAALLSRFPDYKPRAPVN